MLPTSACQLVDFSHTALDPTPSWAKSLFNASSLKDTEWKGGRYTYHQKQVDIIQPQALQALVQALFHPRVIRRPHLGHDKDVFAPDAGGEGLLEALPDLVLVGVAVGPVNELVSVLQREGDGRGDGAGVRLPGSCCRAEFPIAFSSRSYQPILTKRAKEGGGGGGEGRRGAYPIG